MADLQFRLEELETRVHQLEELQKFEMDVQVGMTTVLEDEIEELAEELEILKRQRARQSRSAPSALVFPHAAGHEEPQDASGDNDEKSGSTGNM